MVNITCPMCGHTFDPDLHATCAACPLKKGCQLVCCPACGFETVNPQHSVLARLVMDFSNRRGDRKAPQSGEKSL